MGVFFLRQWAGAAQRQQLRANGPSLDVRIRCVSALGPKEISSARPCFSSRCFTVHPRQKGFYCRSFCMLGGVDHEVSLDPNGFVQSKNRLEFPG